MQASINLTLDEIKSHLTETGFIIPTAQTYQSFETSTKGFHTYGPNGLVLKNKVIDLWRKLLVQGNVHEIDTPILQSKEVLTNSGHVGRFNDLIISNGSAEVFRADHLVKNFAEKNNINLGKPIDDFTKDELLEFVKLHKVVENSENATISPKNLMFGCGNLYLRPEIAQGMFTEFDQFHERFYNLPFGLAQVGKSYRNEISCQPFTRLKEFTQAEVEYFFDPNDETHPYFNQVDYLILPLLVQQVQLENKEDPIRINLNDAVKSGVLVNEILAYFLGKIYLFATTLGIPDDKIRFRQHLPNELSHYARQCWDLEILLVNGQWIECVGCAHRGDYDLTNHNIQGQNFIRKYDTKYTRYKVTLDKKLEKGFSKDEIKDFYLHTKGKLYESTTDVDLDELLKKYKEALLITETQELVRSKVIPYVIEPSVGIDRMIFAIANNLLKKREQDNDRIVFNLKPSLAPYDVGIFVLSNDERLIKISHQLQNVLGQHFKIYTDFSGTSIGKRYVRADQIGVPFIITIDFDTISDNAVTIRVTKDGYQHRYSIEGIKEELLYLMNSV
jgi:glycyl-tRNA synthetase